MTIMWGYLATTIGTLCMAFGMSEVSAFIFDCLSCRCIEPKSLEDIVVHFICNEATLISVSQFVSSLRRHCPPVDRLVEYECISSHLLPCTMRQVWSSVIGRMAFTDTCLLGLSR